MIKKKQSLEEKFDEFKNCMMQMTNDHLNVIENKMYQKLITIEYKLFKRYQQTIKQQDEQLLENKIQEINTLDDIEQKQKELNEKKQEYHRFANEMNNLLKRTHKNEIEIDELKMNFNNLSFSIQKQIQRKWNEFENRFNYFEEQINGNQTLKEMEKIFLKDDIYCQLIEELKFIIKDLIREDNKNVIINETKEKLNELENDFKNNIKDNDKQFENIFHEIEDTNEVLNRNNENKSGSKSLKEISEINSQNIQITEQQIHQLQQWTKKKWGNIIFNTDFDNWSQNNSVLNERIIGKSNLLFLIETTDDEIFGYYMNKNKFFDNKMREWNPVEKGNFCFNLYTPTNRMKKPTIFDTGESKWGYRLYEVDDSALIILGDIELEKQNNKHRCHCTATDKRYYKYIDKALCGKTGKYVETGEYVGEYFEMKKK